VVEVRKDGDADPLEQYVWSARYVHAPVQRTRDSNTDGDLADAGDSTLYYAVDANFNVTGLCDASAAMAERVAYDPYGRSTFYDGSWANPSATSAAAVANDVLFTGHRLDAESGLYYTLHRYYHPTLGRWIIRDPEGYVDGMSLYLYVGGRPCGALDPMGLSVAGDLWTVTKYAVKHPLTTAGYQMKMAGAVVNGNWDRSLKLGEGFAGAAATDYTTADEYSRLGKSLATGGKAVVNGAAQAGYNTVTLGLSDRDVELWGSTAEDRLIGYDVAKGVATGFGELAIGLTTGGAGNFAAAGKLGKASQVVSAGLLLWDGAGNAVTLGRGIGGVAEDGLTLRNGVQCFSGALGLAGNFAALGDALAPNRTVIGKFDPATGNIRGIQPNENSLLKHLPDQGSTKLNWQQNSSVLRTEMGKGVPIRDAHIDSAGRLLPGSPDGISKFIDAERSLLRNHDWTYDPKTTLWSPPAAK
jgi:RHS repeat-associated protein